MSVNLVNLVKALSINSLHEGNIAGSYRTILHKLHSTFLIQAGFDCKRLPVHRFKGFSASRAILHILHGEKAGKGQKSKAPLSLFNAYFGCFSSTISTKLSQYEQGKSCKAIRERLFRQQPIDSVSQGKLKT